LYPEVVSAIKQIGWNQEADYFIRHADDIEVGKPKYEGAAMQVTVTIYERSRVARELSVRHHGCKCSVCGFNFESFYGEIGRDYIHVHHLVPIAKIGEKYVIDPIKDLIPVCPNCHAMLHTNPPPSIEDLRRQINQRV
jgi:5-methylcytosine-specific restriction protein A